MEAHPSCPGGWLPKSIGSREVAGKEKKYFSLLCIRNLCMGHELLEQGQNWKDTRRLLQSDDTPGAQWILPSDLLLPGGFLPWLPSGVVMSLSFDIEQLFPHGLSMPPFKKIVGSWVFPTFPATSLWEMILPLSKYFREKVHRLVVTKYI